jgi:K+-sensing histidine kinase KdpD
MKFTLAYTFLFIYIVAALLFWGYSLQKQNIITYTLEIEKLELKKNTVSANDFQKEMLKIEDKKNRRIKQYWGEGATFLGVILLSACVVYFAFYKQIKLTRQQQNFMMSITHELKTPLAGITLNMQTLEKRNDQLLQETKLKLITSSVKEANRLSDLCNNILIATQLEGGNIVSKDEEVNMNDLLQDVIAEAKVSFPNRSFVANVSDEICKLKGDSILWKLVVSNLIENARKYSNEEKPIVINLLKENSTFLLNVKDEGKGIPDEEKDKIFQKFYRMGNENTRSAKGTGLGLFIIKKIVNQYKYDITVRNNIPTGSIFEIHFSKRIFPFGA